MKETATRKEAFRARAWRGNRRGAIQKPVLTASGTFGYGLEFADFMDLNSIGGIVVKGLSMAPSRESAAAHLRNFIGMLNAIAGRISSDRVCHKETAGPPELRHQCRRQYRGLRTE